MPSINDGLFRIKRAQAEKLPFLSFEKHLHIHFGSVGTKDVMKMDGQTCDNQKKMT